MTSTAIASSQPISHLRAGVCRWPLANPSSDFAGPAYLAGVRDQSERQVLAVRYSLWQTAQLTRVQGAQFRDSKACTVELMFAYIGPMEMFVSTTWFLFASGVL